ncbi:uncharacterized protein MCYG_03586 [Microsporum canis CBS 113480]|uniref:Uncharacterized protein n=1 Tax=Arthroderma otae (strain ATCC MYA-4605 / CBS 113480) TaxID=554155 RepID=C5FM45_ARTOC|nr:uncharacterized protein MCYG_03586 [Microsporum canis CBS 113480]EEQ30767.1 predicted protein [Microsporum canis CBS 113480]
MGCLQKDEMQKRKEKPRKKKKKTKTKRNQRRILTESVGKTETPCGGGVRRREEKGTWGRGRREMDITRSTYGRNIHNHVRVEQEERISILSSEKYTAKRDKNRPSRSLTGSG